LLNCPLPISIWPYGCRLSGSIQVHLTLQLFSCSNLFCPVQLNLHYSTDFMNLLCL
jgi:hypothetical protein